MNPLRESFTQPLRRADYLLLRAMLVIAAALSLAWALLSPIRWLAGESLTWRSLVTVDRLVPVDLASRPGTSVAYDEAVVWTVPDPRAGEIVAAALPRLLTAACVVVGCVLLWRLLSRLRSADVFAAGATATVRGLAVVTLVYAVVVKVVAVLVDFGLTANWQQVPAAYFRLEPGSLVPFALGLMLMALAECFRQGSRLRADVEGLV